MMSTEYPKQMRHPAFVPATNSGYKGGIFKSIDDPVGKPAQFPPVMVNNIEQEKYYASLGYVPQSLSTSFAEYKQDMLGDPMDKIDRDFPCWKFKFTKSENGELKQQSCLVQDAAEAESLGDGWFTFIADAKADAEKTTVKKQPVRMEVVPPVTEQPAVATVPGTEQPEVTQKPVAKRSWNKKAA